MSDQIAFEWLSPENKIRISENWDEQADAILYSGDCLDFLKTIPDNAMQLIVTSPPYNIGKPYEKKAELDQYLAWKEQVIAECVRILNDEGSICWQVGNYVDNIQAKI